MDIFGFEVAGILINAGLIGFIALAVMTLLGVLLVRHFERTGRALFPKLFIVILNLVETPIKNILWLFNLDS